MMRMERRALRLSEHYYTSRPLANHKENSILFQYKNHTYTFISDSSVFSKSMVDFGSRLLIENMVLKINARVLDVGCGYGPIGILAAVNCPDGHVTMIDINERAIECSVINAQKNNIHNVTIKQSDLWAEIKDQIFDVVLTNPPIRAGKKVVHEIFTLAHECLVDGGELWVVIQKKQGAQSAYKKLASMFKLVKEINKDKGYIIYLAQK